MSYGDHRVDQRFIDKARRVPDNERVKWLLRHKPVPVSYEDKDTGKRHLVRMPALAVFAAEALFNKVTLDVSLTSRIRNKLRFSSLPQTDTYYNEHGSLSSVFDPLRQYSASLFRSFYQNNIPLSAESIALLENDFGRVRLAVQDILPREYISLSPAVLWPYFAETGSLDEIEQQKRRTVFAVLSPKLKALIVLYMQKNGVDSTEQWMDREALKAIVSAWTFETSCMMLPNKNEIPHLLFPLYPEVIANWTQKRWKKNIKFWLNNPDEVDEATMALIIKEFMNRFGEEGVRDLRAEITPKQRGRFSRDLLLASETVLVHRLVDECVTALDSPETRDVSLAELNAFSDCLDTSSEEEQEFKTRVSGIKEKFLQQLSETSTDLATNVAILKLVMDHYKPSCHPQFVNRIQIDDTVELSKLRTEMITTMVWLTLKSKSPLLKRQSDELLRRSMLSLNREVLGDLVGYIKNNPGNLAAIWSTFCLADSQVSNIMTMLDWLRSQSILSTDDLNKVKNKLVQSTPLPTVSAPLDFTFCYLTLIQAAGIAIPKEHLNQKGLYTPGFFHEVHKQNMQEKRGWLREIFRHGSPGLSQLIEKVRTDEQVYEALYHLYQYPENLPYEVTGIIENILKSHSVLFPTPGESVSLSMGVS
ncbi:hypothetical protein [Legionella shakespearei]|uniref:Uncharacterized protein n=1 Tax=Legionella shakespearei DSM 23087 TaxID=1122169 RepID=A0A0W0Z7V5_9GAMM|nr:hypothetical protein [Legionella shakespearei]KTD65218.1 hypothetical protein Lsha_0291 [Legionella shakespearei DSM 23087]